MVVNLHYQSLYHWKNLWKIATSEVLSERGIPHQIKYRAPLILPTPKIWLLSANPRDSITVNRAMITEYWHRARFIPAEAMWGSSTRQINIAVPWPAIRAQIPSRTGCIQKKFMTETGAKKSRAFLTVSHSRATLLQRRPRQLKRRLGPVCSKFEEKSIWWHREKSQTFRSTKSHWFHSGKTILWMIPAKTSRRNSLIH